ncbi:spermidine synthase [Paraglaciecola aestuariivivens]
MKNTLMLLNILCSAFLAFQIQPILAKSMLPIFGGGASIWTCTMLFFQGLLLMGYLHAYWLSKLKSVKAQLYLQLSLLFLSALFAPNLILSSSSPVVNASPELSILYLLLVQIGLPFYLLSSTGIMLQHWYSLKITNKKQVYPYYAWSNLGSLSALLAYPFVFELYLGLAQQKVLWLLIYLGFVLINGGLIGLMIKDPKLVQRPKLSNPSNPISKLQIFLWVALAGSGVLVLLSTTHLLTLNITPMPFLWVLPFSLYLGSYILSFLPYAIYQRSYWIPLLLFSFAAAILMFFFGSQFNSLAQIFMYNFILFVVCMVCHAELRQHCPDTQHLTLFYLCIAVGGVIAGIAISLLAPVLFTKITEYPLSMLLVYLLIGLSFVISHAKECQLKIWPIAAGTLSLVGLVVVYVNLDKAYSRFDIASARNFYGYLSVKDVQQDQQTIRHLVDGTTIHGSANLTRPHSTKQGYYAADSGIAKAIHFAQQQASMKMAVIGLGAGVLASYGRSADSITFYEINPNVAEFALQYFDYLELSAAQTEVVIGDGRLTLSQQFSQTGSQKFDLLVIDAFSSDAIPIHLLTLEALQLYWQHLNNDGLLVLHVSNNHIDLHPVIATLAHKLNKKLYRFNSGSNQIGDFASQWLILSNNLAFERSYGRYNKWVNPRPSHTANLLWTDDYNTLLAVIKI